MYWYYVQNKYDRYISRGGNGSHTKEGAGLSFISFMVSFVHLLAVFPSFPVNELKIADSFHCLVFLADDACGNVCAQRGGGV